MEQPFDDTAKTFYHQLFSGWGMKVETEREVFSRSRAIDLVIECTEADLAYLRNTVFSNFREQNGVELKGPNDPLTVSDLNIIMMRIWALGGIKLSKKDKKANPNRIIYDMPDERTVTIICVVRPDKILNQLQNRLKFYPTSEKGIYHCDERLPQWIIHPSELALEPKNYPLLPLARGKKLQQFIDICLRDGLVHYLQLVLDVGFATDPETIWHKILEATNMKHMISEETWPVIDEFFRQTPEALDKLPFFRNAIEKKKQEARQKEWQEALQKGKIMGALLAQQNMLIRQLQRKFTDVPHDVILQIQATNESEILDEWMLQILDADSLSQMGFSVTSPPEEHKSTNGNNGNA